jgi:hypothetical protein
LDNWITGHYGEDQYRNDPPEIEDEGLSVLQSAMDYLQPRADADEDEQFVGDYEAFSILTIAYNDILQEYTCHFCGKPIARRKDKFCSHGCYRADHEGL